MQEITHTHVADAIVQWFPLRVTYGRELKMKAHLEAEGIEVFLPMQYQWMERDGQRHYELQPAIHNLLFVHASQQRITRLKMFDKEAEPLRYIMVPDAERPGETRILTIPDRQMDNFLLVARHQDDSVIFLDYSDLLRSKGEEVLVAEGPFAGVTGRIQRIQRNKHVVVTIDGLAAVAIAYTPRAFISKK